MIKEVLSQSCSQSFQDIFVYYLLENNFGYFLDISCSNYKEINNTYFLEKKGWTGLCIDLIDYKESYNKYRECKFICSNLLQNNINDILEKNDVPHIIDYISFDVDSATLKVLKDFNFEKYKFKVMTFEHDIYKDGEDGENKRTLSRNILNKMNNKLLCSDVRNNGNPYEDWWINPDYIDESKYKILESDGENNNLLIQKIFIL